MFRGWGLVSLCPFWCNVSCVLLFARLAFSAPVGQCVTQANSISSQWAQISTHHCVAGSIYLNEVESICIAPTDIPSICPVSWKEDNTGTPLTKALLGFEHGTSTEEHDLGHNSRPISTTVWIYIQTYFVVTYLNSCVH